MSNYEISKSSLLSLKAEILRKQDDLAKAKIENVEKIKNIKKKTPLELKNKGVEERSRNDLDEEDQDLLKLSRSKLEAKAKLYEKLSGTSNQCEEVNKRYLVRFDQKSKVSDQLSSDSESLPDLRVDSDDEERHFSDEYDEAVDPSEEWVEYTDCLGRSRKCLRKDLEYLKSKDALLLTAKSTSVTSDNFKNNVKGAEDSSKNNVESEQTKMGPNLDVQSQISNEESELISGDMRREMLRQQWEKEEEELKEKTDIHYQNVLFNEARQHGVGYYAFSKDEEERAKQQEALTKLRQETQQQQRKAQDLKALREKQMAARMKAARNRRRARLGLPPEEEDLTPSSELKQEPEDEKKKQEQKKSEEAEKLLMEARKRHVRPWDIGKEGVSQHYEMTQEEWNDKKRQERPEEFAPPKSYSKRDFSGMQSVELDIEENDKSLKFSTKKRKNIDSQKPTPVNFRIIRNKNNTLKPNDCSDYKKSVDNNSDDADDCFLKDYKKSQDLPSSSSSATLGLLNSYETSFYEPTEPTSDIDDNDTLLRDYKTTKTTGTAMEPTSIINEIEDDFNDELLTDYNKIKQSISLYAEENSDEETNNYRKRGVEIAPPPIFEYYGPVEGKRAKTSRGQFNIAESIEAGLKFLRKQANKKGRHCIDDM